MASFRPRSQSDRIPRDRLLPKSSALSTPLPLPLPLPTLPATPPPHTPPTASTFSVVVERGCPPSPPESVAVSSASSSYVPLPSKSPQLLKRPPSKRRVRLRRMDTWVWSVVTRLSILAVLAVSLLLLYIVQSHLPHMLEVVKEVERTSKHLDRYLDALDTVFKDLGIGDALALDHARQAFVDALAANGRGV